MAADYFLRHMNDADGLAAELDTPERRRAYVATFYGSRFWAAPGAFAPGDVAFMTEPFADAERFRASLANYEYAGGRRRAPERPRYGGQPHPRPHPLRPEDHVIPRDFMERMEAAFPDRAGPFVVPGAGHFLMWERPRCCTERSGGCARLRGSGDEAVAAAFQVAVTRVPARSPSSPWRPPSPRP